MNIDFKKSFLENQVFKSNNDIILFLRSLPCYTTKLPEGFFQKVDASFNFCQDPFIIM